MRWFRCGRLLPWLYLALATTVSAQNGNDCVLNGILNESGDKTIAEIRASCATASESEVEGGTEWMDCMRLRAVSADDKATVDAIKAECRELVASGVKLPTRIIQSRTTETNPYVITPLRQNYILPYTYNQFPEHAALEIGDDDEPLDKEEAKLQISLMVPIIHTDLLVPNDGLYFGFTLKSFWQVYNKGISAPFRETNYRPEVFYQMPLPIASSRGVWLGRLGIEHESNGRTQYRSRSWNRIYVTVGYLRPNWGLLFQPWYRIPESKKKDDGDPGTPPPASGDDNPDIEDYMGNYELTGVYRWQKLEFSGLFRRNFEEGHGAHEIGVSFPLWGRMRGFAQYFEGHGESLIDYDHKTRRIGIGVLLTDLL